MSNTETSGFTRLIAETHRSQTKRKPKPKSPARTKPGRVPSGEIGHEPWFVDNAPAVVHLDLADLEEVDHEPDRARDPWENADTRPYDPSELPQYAEHLRPPRKHRRRWALMAILFGGALWGTVAIYLLAAGTTKPATPKPLAHSPSANVPVPAQALPALPPRPVITPVPLLATLELPNLTATTSVHIDGTPLGAGPMRIDQLEAGPHVLLLQQPGGAPLSVDINLAANVVTRITDTAPRPERARKHRSQRKHRKH